MSNLISAMKKMAEATAEALEYLETQVEPRLVPFVQAVRAPHVTSTTTAAPAKRRGRPPKAKVAPAAAAEPKRRGRPPKAKPAEAAPAPEKAKATKLPKQLPRPAKEQAKQATPRTAKAQAAAVKKAGKPDAPSIDSLLSILGSGAKSKADLVAHFGEDKKHSVAAAIHHARTKGHVVVSDEGMVQLPQ